MALVSLAILPLGLGSIHVMETLRWYESRRGIWKMAVLADGLFLTACVFLAIYREGRFGAALYFRTVFEMLFAGYFLVTLAYAMYCGHWVLTRLGRRVFLDELLSRLFALAVFASVDLGAYLVLMFVFGGVQ